MGIQGLFQHELWGLSVDVEGSMVSIMKHRPMLKKSQWMPLILAYHQPTTTVNKTATIEQRGLPHQCHR